MFIACKRIIILDDDSLHNTLATLYIKKTFPTINIDIVGFTNPLAGLNYIQAEYTTHPVETILFLDINMPELSGWQVLEKLKSMPYIVKWFSIYILSSSVDERDAIRAHQNQLVQSYLEKPLANHLTYIFSSLTNLAVV